VFTTADNQIIFTLSLIFHIQAKIEKFIAIKILKKINQAPYFSNSQEYINF
jgi:hypothetical protein